MQRADRVFYKFGKRARGTRNCLGVNLLKCCGILATLHRCHLYVILTENRVMNIAGYPQDNNSGRSDLVSKNTVSDFRSPSSLCSASTAKASSLVERSSNRLRQAEIWSTIAAPNCGLGSMPITNYGTGWERIVVPCAIPISR